LFYIAEKNALTESPNIHQLVDHLFRREAGKLTTVLTKLFGTHNLQLAEDVVQDTLLKAYDTWKINGLPDNPSAWLFTVARNKAVDSIRRQKHSREYAKTIIPPPQPEDTISPLVEKMVNSLHMDDDQLRMMLVCCHPSLSPEAQVSLILKTLCGFSVTEISRAFVTGYDTIEKRLYRARQHFRDNPVPFELPGSAELENRLDTVLMAIYLLFNEGYNSTHHADLIRSDLMKEAIRLCEIVCESREVNSYNAHALIALMCFNAARSEARLDAEGNILLLKQQDRSKWSRYLINRGIEHLEASANGSLVSKYHLEAGIAYEHARAADYHETNWSAILECYNLLQQYYPSPVVALNRAIVVSELNGPAAAIAAIESIPDLNNLKNFYLLPATLGELNWQLKRYDIARTFFAKAIELTQSATEKKLLQQKMTQSGSSDSY
jgi:RNA polymerase sigma factor (sigma-70 family)